jgi:hypothetical protein
MDPVYFPLAAPVIALAVLLMQIPRRIANWHVRRASLRREIEAVERRHRLAMVAVSRDCERRHRRAAEIAARNRLTSAGLLGRSRRVIETEFTLSALKRSLTATTNSPLGPRCSTQACSNTGSPTRVSRT